ncbi:6,7-dimethyl-8-ribityllumazine synthase, partial [Vibrio sp. F12]
MFNTQTWLLAVPICLGLALHYHLYIAGVKARSL